jgi:hypothetical protein
VHVFGKLKSRINSGYRGGRYGTFTILLRKLEGEVLEKF